MTTTDTNTNDKQYPSNWRISADYDPNAHLMNLKGRDYMNVQNRLLWFIRDQRDFIVRGLATTSYVIRSELIQHDREAGYAHFSTYVRDVLGNEATMYGSETAKDFPDYAEKASTKSLGRALLALGYGTAFAPEMDEGERVVDSPVERRQPKPNSQHASVRAPQPQQTAQTPPAAQEPTHDSDPLALTHASALDQKRLAGQLAARWPTDEAQAGFLMNVTGRAISVEQLRDGRSDLSVMESARANERLTRIPTPAHTNGKAAHA